MSKTLQKIDICEECFKNKAEYFLERNFILFRWYDFLCKDCACKKWNKHKM